MPNLMRAYEQCVLCPRACKARRLEGKAGVCGSTSELRIARAALHYWEEPPISGESGSGAIFFSGCPLRCVFCQNHQISSEGQGLKISVGRLAKIMLELEDQGALNINLVTPSHFSPHVVEAARLARKEGLSLPFLCNTSGYESPQTIRMLSEVVDVWLTDFKYADSSLAARLSGAPDYPQVATTALDLMVKSVKERGGRLIAHSGAMRRGVIVRHLVLPGEVADSCAVLDRVWKLCGNAVDLSIMNQYTPNERCRMQGGPLARALSDEEYEIVLCHADDLGFERLWWQQGGTVSESYVPEFDATGVRGPELADQSDANEN